MTSSSQAEKRQRAATFPDGGPILGAANPSYGPLQVVWESAFDRMCYMVSGVDLAIKNPRRYRKLMDEIVTRTGCTEAEVLTHGDKVRALLFFAHDKLEREGALRDLVGKDKYQHRFPAVNPVF